MLCQALIPSTRMSVATARWLGGNEIKAPEKTGAVQKPRHSKHPIYVNCCSRQCRAIVSHHAWFVFGYRPVVGGHGLWDIGRRDYAKSTGPFSSQRRAHDGREAVPWGWGKLFFTFCAIA